VNDFLLGSFDATITGNESLTNYSVDATIKNDVTKSFAATGDIFVSRKQSKIDVDLDFDAFNLSPLNPLLDGVLSDIRGEANGNVKVVGDLRKPNINGDLVVKNGGLGIPYLNVDYDFNTDASVTLINQSFIFNRIRLTDSKHKSIGFLDGALSHVNFAKWNLDLSVSTPRLLILDTEETEESLYYGTGFIGGRATISGPTEQLAISVVGETKQGTVFKILLVEINTNGKFDMWGDFSVFEGVYNFAYGGLIQKEFIVQPGGSIAWEGEPAEPLINMLATYKTQTNPSPLLDNPINRSIPVELNISLNGDLEELDPDFGFEFPNVNSAIKSELQYRLESDENKQNQALYLISTGSFSRGIDELNFSGTIAERLNGIINGIFTSEDGKINVGLNYEAGQNRPDYQTDDRFGVTLRTQISDRVLINGKVGVPVGGATETVIAGDVEIDFLLNEEGTLTAKVFNRENSIRNFGEQIGYTQGIGLSYNVDFDTFKELIQKLFKKQKEDTPLIEETLEKKLVFLPQEEILLV